MLQHPNNCIFVLQLNRMQKYIASRLSDGNKLYRSSVVIDERGVTLHAPGFFSGKESTIPFSRISSVDIEVPLIGYSTIRIETTGEGKITVHGFTKSEVREMKETILSRM